MYLARWLPRVEPTIDFIPLHTSYDHPSTGSSTSQNLLDAKEGVVCDSLSAVYQKRRTSAPTTATYELPRTTTTSKRRTSRDNPNNIYFKRRTSRDSPNIYFKRRTSRDNPNNIYFKRRTSRDSPNIHFKRRTSRDNPNNIYFKRRTSRENPETTAA
jgi:hypothetical protein